MTTKYGVEYLEYQAVHLGQATRDLLVDQASPAILSFQVVLENL